MGIGDNIRTRRKELGMSQGELGQAIGITVQSVSQYERGIARPTPENLKKVALALGCGVADLLDISDVAEMIGCTPADLIGIGLAPRSSTQSAPPSERVDAAMKQLNYDGQTVAADVAEGLAQLPRYRKASDTSSTPSSEPEK